MDFFYKTIQKIIKNYGKMDIVDDVYPIEKDENIPKLINLFYKFKERKYKELMLNIIHDIKRSRKPVHKKYIEMLTEFLEKELNKKELLWNKIELVADYKIIELGDQLLQLLLKKGDKLKVGELDTLLYVLGTIKHKTAKKYIKKYINSKHETVKNCAREALIKLK